MEWGSFVLDVVGKGAGKEVEGVNILPAIDYALGLWGLGCYCVAEVDRELADERECGGIRDGLIKAVEFGEGMFEEVYVRECSRCRHS